MKFNLKEQTKRLLVDSSLNNCTRWCENRIHMPHPFEGVMSFDRFPWQRDVLNIEEGIVTVKKAAQIGFSVAGMVRALYVLSEKKQDVLYILPTHGLALDFSKSRMDALTDLSPDLTDMFSVNNSSTLKTTAQRTNLYIRGSVAEKNLVSVPVASAIIDEYDRCNEKTYDLVTERLSGQLSKYLFSLSTPTMPEFGIDAQFQAGTQEEFFFKCPSCSKMETLRFPDNVAIYGDFPNDPECQKSYYFCTLCDNKLPELDGKMEMLRHTEWVPKQHVQGHRSFHINQMFSLTVTPGELVNKYQAGQVSEIAEIEFKNQKLGESHLGENARLSDAIINNCMTGERRIGEDRPEFADRMICMGIDVGKFLDCYIAEYTYDGNPGNEPYLNSVQHLLQVIRIPGDDWHILDQVMAEWQVRYAAIDFQPGTTMQRRFCKRFPKCAAMVAYRRGTVGNEIKEVTDEHRVPMLTIDRTAFLDMALGRFHKGRATIPQNTPGYVREHLKAMARTYEEDELGVPRGVYKTTPGADDHFAHAALYCEVAHFRAYCQHTGRVIKPEENI